MCDKQSDQGKFDVESFRNRLQGFIMQSVNNWAIAEELTQETILAFWKSDNANTIKGDRRKFLFGIAYNQVMAFRRKKKSIPISNEILDTHQSPDTEYPRTEKSANLQQLLNLLREHLKAEDVALMTMKYLDQMTFKQIAAELGCSVGNASDRHQRILKQLRVIVKENPPSDFEAGSLQ